MNDSPAWLVWFLAFGIAACAVAARYAWSNQHTRGRRLFSLASGSACFWMLGDLIGRRTTSFDGTFISELIRYFGVMNVPV